jgi:hypothetical protein
VGAGFSGFANRSTKRYRTSHTLDESRFLAENTLLIHHSMLLDPNTGQDRSQVVRHALDLLFQEIVD